MAVAAHKKGLELNCQISPALPKFVIGDLLSVRQVIINLPSNAIKFTEAGEVNMWLEPDPDAKEPGAVRFLVSKNGIRIPPDKIERIFDIFTEADDSTTRDYGDIGLGLAICRRLVGLMTGSIWVKSALGMGSNFYFTAMLPAAEFDDSAPDPRLSDINGLKALIIDDNPTNRLILLDTIKSWNVRPTAVEDTEQGLAEIERA
jgi:two-component system sensor histidine kinase/response regulator